MKSGRELLIENLLVENYPRYYRLAYSYVHNADDAQDIVQEGAYKAIFQCKSLREDTYASTWIYRIMLNEIFSFCRQRSRLQWECLDECSAPQADFSTGEEKSLSLQEALGHLSAEDKAVVELRYFEGMELKEIAGVLDENLSTVKSRLYRALRKLRVSMSD